MRMKASKVTTDVILRRIVSALDDEFSGDYFLTQKGQGIAFNLRKGNTVTRRIRINVYEEKMR